MTDKLDILKKIKDTGYREPDIQINSDEFFKVIETRRSVRVFLNDPVTDEHLDKIIDAGLLAPNSSNLQCWEFYLIKDPKKLKDVKRICMNQSAARTAPCIVVAVAKMNTWKWASEKMIKSFDESEVDVPKGAYTYYQSITKMAYGLGPLGIIGLAKKIALTFKRLTGAFTPNAQTSYADMRVWAHKSTALACQNIMLAARALGYHTCPMEGLDPYQLKDLLNLDSKSEVCMAISIGKKADHGILGPRLRFEREHFVKTI